MYSLPLPWRSALPVPTYVCPCPDTQEATPGPAASQQGTVSAGKRQRQEEKSDQGGEGQNSSKRSKPSPRKGGTPAKRKGPLDSFFIKNPA